MESNKVVVVSKRLQRLTNIARRSLRMSTLRTRRDDSLDFYALCVWNVKEALIAAFEAGIADTKETLYANLLEDVFTAYEEADDNMMCHDNLMNIKERFNKLKGL